MRQDSVFLGEDFEVGPGPKFHVYLLLKAPIRASGDLRDEMLSILAGFGRSREASAMRCLPASISRNTGSVLIWCEQFSVLISPADLVHQPNA